MNPRQRAFFMLPIGWEKSDHVRQLGPTARFVLLGLVQYCQFNQNGGVMTGREVHAVAKETLRGVASVQQLIDVGVLAQVGVRSTFDARSEHVQDTGENSNTRSMHVRSTFDARSEHAEATFNARWMLVQNTYWFISEQNELSINAGQTGPATLSSIEDGPRARPREARGKKERKKEEENRTPSGSVRFSSARDAPRDAGGATRHAPKHGDQAPGSDRVEPTEKSGTDEEPPMDSKSAMAMMRETIAKSSMYSGRPAKLRKYPMELHSVGEPSPPVILSGNYE